jgi:hypothetical protein
MDLSKIISVPGISGLHKVIAQSKNGFIVEALSDKKRIPVQSNSKISVLDNISIYINSGDTIPLSDLFKKMYDKQAGKAAPDAKASSDDELKKFFESVLPEYDKDKVHASDIRKALLWYNQLQTTDVFTKKDEAKKEGDSLLKVEDNDKKTFSDLGKPNQGKQLNANMNAPKKTMGVRKTGTA